MLQFRVLFMHAQCILTLIQGDEDSKPMNKHDTHLTLIYMWRNCHARAFRALSISKREAILNAETSVALMQLSQLKCFPGVGNYKKSLPTAPSFV